MIIVVESMKHLKETEKDAEQSIKHVKLTQRDDNDTMSLVLGGGGFCSKACVQGSMSHNPSMDAQ